MNAAPTPRRILVTAFEPFGPPGKSKRDANASEEVVRAFRGNHPGRCDVRVLPVGPLAEVHLARALQLHPLGVVGMGETGQEGEWDTNVEPGAADITVRTGGLRPGTPMRASEFATSIPLLPGMEREVRIGAYWCNRIYFRALEWSHIHRIPAVFLHLRVGCDRRRQREHLEHVVAHMERVVGGR